MLVKINLIRLPVKAFVGYRSITPSDIQDLLCGPTENDGLQAASQQATQYFYGMVKNIFCCKEQNERIDEAEGRVNLVAAAPID